MKKIIIVIVSIFALFFILGHLFFFFMDNKYIIGRDTVESFGNGRYQIIRISIDKDVKERNTLYDLKENTTIESDIYMFHHNKKNSTVYIIGINGYTVLKYGEEGYKQSKSLQDFTDEENSLFISCSYNTVN